MVNWDGILVKVNALVAYQELKKYVGYNNYEDCKNEWLLLSSTEDNEQLRVINHN